MLTAFCADDLTRAANPGTGLVQIEDTTNAIVKSELEMLALDTKFRIESARPNKWKRWRVFTYKLAASSLTEAGITTVAVSRWKYYQHPQLAPQGLLQAGPICNLTAASIVVGGTALEGILNQLHDHKLKDAGLDAKSALQHFLKIRSGVDKLLAERDGMIQAAQLSDIQRQVIDADGTVLKDLRDLASIQFSNYYVRTKRARMNRDAGTALSLAGAGTGGYMGSLNSLLGVTNHDPRLGGTAGIGFIISGTIVALTPLLNAAAGKIASHATQRKLQECIGDLNTKSIDIFEADRQHLLELIEKADSSELTLLKGLSARNSAYELQKAIFEDQNIIATKQAEQRIHSLKERLVFSNLVGGTNLARGVQLVVAGFKYPNSPTTAFELTAAASTTYMVGAGAWIFDTLQDRIRAEALSRKLKVAKLSTQVQLQQRLQGIEELEEVINLY